MFTRRNPYIRMKKFNMRIQEELDSFIISHYWLAEHCNYHDLHDTMIQDQIVVGLRDSSDPELRDS